MNTSSPASNYAGSATEGLGRVARDAASAVSQTGVDADIGQAAASLSKTAKDLWTDGKQVASDTLRRYSDRLSERGQDAYAKGEAALAQTAQYVRRKPVQAMLVAAVGAYILGHLIARRSR